MLGHVLLILLLLKTLFTAPNAAPKKFRFISKTSSTITFKWNRLHLNQVDDKITWYVIACSSLQEKNIVTVSDHT